MSKGTYFYGVWLSGKKYRHWLNDLSENRAETEEKAIQQNSYCPHYKAVVRRIYVPHPKR